MPHGPRRFRAAIAVLLAVVAVPGLVPGGAGADAAPRVTVISDSVLTSVTWGNAAAQAALSQGLDLQIDAGVCRRLNGQSCEFDNAYVPTTMNVIDGWITRLGSVVVIVDGYNDLPDHFAADVELTLDTLRDHGVQHVLWVNLHEVRPEYAAKNEVLRAAAQHHPELRVLDWNSYSANHPEWYQSDFMHLVPAGGVAIATWLRHAIGEALAPPAPAPTPTPTPRAAPEHALVVHAHETMLAHVGHRLNRLLKAAGGTAPLRWRTTNGSLRTARLHLLANGKVSGRPAHAGRYVVPLELRDARGAIAHVSMTLVVKPAVHAARRPHRLTARSAHERA